MAPRKSLVPGISCHSFNGDGSKVVLSPNNNELHVYATNGSEDFTQWTLEHRLGEHGGFVASVDWNAQTNAIVSCGHDRNAYVWKLKDGKWAPTLVIARLTRAATCVRWDASGAKFAVASASKQVAVCYYEPRNDWYVAKSIKKHKSTVTSLSFSPTGTVLVTGSTDAKLRVFSAYIKGVDAEGSDGGLADVFSGVHKFGELLFEAPAGSWVNATAFSPDGRTAAFATQGSALVFARFEAGAEPALQTVQLPTVPYLAVEFADENTLVAAGFGNIPVVFKNDGGVWSHSSNLDKEEEQKVEAKASKFGAARAMFAASANKGVAIDNASGSAVKETKLNSRHQNCVTSLNVRGSTVTTAGIDGCVYYWQL